MKLQIAQVKLEVLETAWGSADEKGQLAPEVGTNHKVQNFLKSQVVNNGPLLENAAGPSLTGSDVLFEDQTLMTEVKTGHTTKEIEIGQDPVISHLNPDTTHFVPHQQIPSMAAVGDHSIRTQSDIHHNPYGPCQTNAVGSTEKYFERKTATTTMVQERTIRGSHQELMFLAVTDIVNQLIQAHIQKKDVNLNSIKGKSASKYGLASQPRLVDIIAAGPQQFKRALVPKLKAKPVCTASGIAVVAVMCKPHSCPHIAMTGNIYVYYPGDPDSDFEYSTQSYTGYEPTSMRAIRARYNPYLHTRHRVEQLKQLGHSVDKVEFVVMSGTFMILSEEYRDFFHPESP